MPGSDISRLSFAGQPKSEVASQIARDEASQEISRMINSGMLDRNDTMALRREWKNIYLREYYKCYAIMAANNQQIQYVPVDNPTARKFLPNVRHAIGGFSRSNLFIHVNMNDTVIVSKFEYPLDSDKSLETKEAFLRYWPGPLDGPDDSKLKREIFAYISKLFTHSNKRRIRYERNDEQREVILMLLEDLLHHDGSMNASSATKLLLGDEHGKINGDERPLEMLQKYLLLGQRSEAIKHATEHGLWDLMLCLTFLDQHQPPPLSNAINRIDINGPMIGSNTAFIDSMEDGDRNILKIVYRALLNNILKSDSRFVHVVKRPNVENDPYRFAILSANDCDMDYDKTNEKFNLINAIKTAPRSVSNNHLINLGLTKQEINEPRLHPEDELLDHSLLSLGDRQPDTYAKRTHIISNIDLLILNEIWEYCYNLARGSTGPVNYQYNIDLIPYKLVFAARLLDAGLYGMFASYLRSIKAAINQGQLRYELERDSFYDWDAIVRSVEHLSDLWRVICESPALAQYRPKDVLDHMSPPTEPITFNPPPPATFDTTSHQAQVPPPLVSAFQKLNVSTRSERLDSPNQSYPSPRSQGESAFTQNFPMPPIPRMHHHHHLTGHGAVPAFSQPPPAIAEEVTDFNPDPEPYEQDEQQEAQDFTDYQPQHPQQPQQPSPQHHLHQHQEHQQQQNQHQQPQQQQQQQQMMQQRQLFQQQQQQQQLVQQQLQQQEEFQQQQQLQHQRQQQHEQQQQQPPHYPPPPAMQQRQPQPPPPSQHQNSGPEAESSYERNDHSNQSSARPSLDNGDSRNPNRPNESQPGFIASLAGRLLPKSNSKPMILPDDSNPSIVYDENRGTWTDTSKPEGEDTLDLSAPPPVQAVRPPPGGYSFPTRSTKSRYPRAQV